MYRVYPPDRERWIFIFSDDPDEPEEFAALVKAYCSMVHGKITEISEDMQYKIDGDELGLIFQWDDCFGITVIVPNSTDIDIAFNTLKNLCDTIC